MKLQDYSEEESGDSKDGSSSHQSNGMLLVSFDASETGVGSRFSACLICEHGISIILEGSKAFDICSDVLDASVVSPLDDGQGSGVAILLGLAQSHFAITFVSIDSGGSDNNNSGSGEE